MASIERQAPAYYTVSLGSVNGHSAKQKTRTFSPGALLREVVLPELGITQGEFADQLGVSRRTVSVIVHERRPVTPDMAIRLGKLLGNGAGIWLRMQQAVDVWTLEQQGNYSHIQQLKAA